MINTGIGWHEARIPTIAAVVPRGAFTWVTAKLKGSVTVPLITTNRINTPEVAESVLARGDADMVSMARPLLADPEFVAKAAENRAVEINTCIGCNQACLDHIFEGKIASCLVNPRACHETELNYRPTSSKKRIAVVGAGPAGMACAAVAALRGHTVFLYEQKESLGGQLNLAVQIPGKEEFNETLRYFKRQLELHNVTVQLNTNATAEELVKNRFDVIVLATGVEPRIPDIHGINHPSVLSYAQVLTENRPIGKNVAIIGAGGIGFDVAEFLIHSGQPDSSQDPDTFFKEWGIDTDYANPGGLAAGGPQVNPTDRNVYLLQRKGGKLGQSLGKTTGWIHRMTLKRQKVNLINHVTYEKIDDQGLHISRKGDHRVLAVDTIIVCAGQEPVQHLYEKLSGESIPLHLIGGAENAIELDAKRAIDQGCRLAAVL